MTHTTGIERALSSITQLGTEWILWVLLGLSVLGMTVIVERSVYFWRSKENVERLTEDVRALMSKRRLHDLKVRLLESRSPAAAMASVALDCEQAEEANELMLGAAEYGRLEMERYLSVLSTLGSNAPFVGLLGTVIGIVGAFRELDHSRGALTEGLMSDIGEALVATAVGLMVALPAIAAFNLFRRIVQARVAQMESVRHSVMAHYKRHRQRVAGAD